MTAPHSDPRIFWRCSPGRRLPAYARNLADASRAVRGCTQRGSDADPTEVKARSGVAGRRAAAECAGSVGQAYRWRHDN